jgi:hypothetical protein
MCVGHQATKLLIRCKLALIDLLNSIQAVRNKGEGWRDRGRERQRCSRDASMSVALLNATGIGMWHHREQPFVHVLCDRSQLLLRNFSTRYGHAHSRTQAYATLLGVCIESVLFSNFRHDRRFISNVSFSNKGWPGFTALHHSGYTYPLASQGCYGAGSGMCTAPPQAPHTHTQTHTHVPKPLLAVTRTRSCPLNPIPETRNPSLQILENEVAPNKGNSRSLARLLSVSVSAPTPAHPFTPTPIV